MIDLPSNTIWLDDGRLGVAIVQGDRPMVWSGNLNEFVAPQSWAQYDKPCDHCTRGWPPTGVKSDAPACPDCIDGHPLWVVRWPESQQQRRTRNDPRRSEYPTDIGASGTRNSTRTPRERSGRGAGEEEQDRPLTQWACDCPRRLPMTDAYSEQAHTVECVAWNGGPWLAARATVQVVPVVVGACPGYTNDPFRPGHLHVMSDGTCLWHEDNHDLIWSDGITIHSLDPPPTPGHFALIVRLVL